MLFCNTVPDHLPSLNDDSMMRLLFVDNTKYYSLLILAVIVYRTLTKESPIEKLLLLMMMLPACLTEATNSRTTFDLITGVANCSSRLARYCGAYGGGRDLPLNRHRQTTRCFQRCGTAASPLYVLIALEEGMCMVCTYGVHVVVLCPLLELFINSSSSMFVSCSAILISLLVIVKVYQSFFPPPPRPPPSLAYLLSFAVCQPQYDYTIID